jgi:hypothetical protein
MFFLLALDASPAAPTRDAQDDFACAVCGRPVSAATPGRLCIFRIDDGREGGDGTDARPGESGGTESGNGSLHCRDGAEDAPDGPFALMDMDCAQAVVNAVFDAAETRGDHLRPVLAGQYSYCPIEPVAGWPDVRLVNHPHMDIWDRIGDGAHRSPNNRLTLRLCRVPLWCDLLNATPSPEYMKLVATLSDFVAHPLFGFGSKRPRSGAPMLEFVNAAAGGIVDTYNAARGTASRTLREVVVDVAVRAGAGQQAVRTIHLAEFSRHLKLMGGDARNRLWTPSPMVVPRGTKRTDPQTDAG